MSDLITQTIHQQAQRLVVLGHLPQPYTIDPLDQRPLWDVAGLAELLSQRPDELIGLLRKNGPVFSTSDRGVPSSWRALIEL
jgi:hypothetical protein